MGYDPRPFIPSPSDRTAGTQLIERLRATPGEVLIPFHPFYAHLAGKRAFLHRMGVLDVGRAGLGAPRGLAQAIAEHRFSVVVMDNKIDGNWQMWPGLQSSYRVADHLSGGPRVVSGSPTEPRYVLVPNVAPPVVDREP
jgi:hypothetical protein